MEENTQRFLANGYRFCLRVGLSVGCCFRFLSLFPFLLLHFLSFAFLPCCQCRVCNTMSLIDSSRRHVRSCENIVTRDIQDRFCEVSFLIVYALCTWLIFLERSFPSVSHFIYFLSRMSQTGCSEPARSRLQTKSAKKSIKRTQIELRQR